MGTTYHVFCLNNDEAIEWMDTHKVPYPKREERFRNPTPTEIAAVVGYLEDYTVDVRRDLSKHVWEATITPKDAPKETPATILAIENYQDDRSPHEFAFKQGELTPIFLIVETLAHWCGPLVVFDSSNMIPFVVKPNAPIDALIEGYNNRRPAEE